MIQSLFLIFALCTPFEFRSDRGFVVVHNCHPVRLSELDRAFDIASGDFFPWVIEAAPSMTRIVIAPYQDASRECRPAVKYAVLSNGDWRGYTLVLHPRADRDAQTQAFHALLEVLAWQRGPDFYEPWGCAE